MAVLLLFWIMSSSDLPLLLRLNDLHERFFYETRRLMLDIVVVAVIVVDIVVVASLSQVALNWKRATFHAIYCTYLRITDRQLRIEAKQSTIFD